MPTHPRELFIDATRGLAMLGVMTAHFAWIFSSLHAEFTLGIVLANYAAPSAPTFMLISGSLLGYVYEMRDRQLGKFALKLMDRGLFLLTAGHLIIMAAYISYAGGIRPAATYGQITDAIGIAIIIGPLLVTHVGAKGRILIGLSLFVLTWIAIAFWEPQAAAGQWLKDTLFGAELERRSRWGYNFPLVPWVSLYIIATALGQHLAKLRKRGDDRKLNRRLFIFAAVGLGATLAFKLFWRAADSFFDIDTSSSSLGYVVYSLTNVQLKWPPSPAYFVFNGAISTALLAVLFFFERKGLFSKILRLLSTIGQNSLFVFLFQEHVYVSLLWMANPPLNQWWTGIFVFTLFINVAAVYVWRRFAATGVFTVGFGNVWGPRSFGSCPRRAAHN